MAGKDTASNAVNAVTFNAQLARKVAAAQLKRRGLKRELTTAETQLAQVTLYLAEQGSVTHPELDEPVRRARAAQDELNAVDDEIARLMAQFTTKPPSTGDSGEAGGEGEASAEGEVVD
ncbi:MAG: hypothetical protein ACXVP1_09300 [Thermoleophilia bacterium]